MLQDAADVTKPRPILVVEGWSQAFMFEYLRGQGSCV